MDFTNDFYSRHEFLNFTGKTVDFFIDEDEMNCGKSCEL